MDRRVTLIAGSGSLVPHLIAAAKTRGDDLQVIALVTRPDLDPTWLRLDAGQVSEIIAAIKAFGSTHIAMAGGVHLSDADRKAFGVALGLDANASAPVGDAGLGAIGLLLGKTTGASLLNLDALAPELMAPRGRVAGPEPSREQRDVALFAFTQARAAGRLDLGQALIASGRRLIAVEDIGGTDLLLERVAKFRERGLIGTGVAPVVLAKASKPGQPAFLDLPAIGPDTVTNAAAAGVTVIAVEAGRTLLLDRAALDAAAEARGISVIGLAADG